MSLTKIFTKAAFWGGGLLLGAIMTEPIIFCFSHFNMGGIALMTQLSAFLNPLFDASGLTDLAFTGAEIMGFSPSHIAAGIGAGLGAGGELILR